MKSLVVILLALIGAPGWAKRGTAQTRVVQPRDARSRACTARLLAATPPYHASRFQDLVGHYRWTSVDTVSTRLAIPPELLERMRKVGRSLPTEFRLWRTDPALRKAVPPRAGDWGHGAIGPLSGELVHADTAGFSPDHPQVEVTSDTTPYLEILYDPRVGRGLLDGGHVMEVLPIEVMGDWGFGGYYDTRGDLLAVKDRNGKLIPSFAGYYCAFKLTP